MPKILIHTNVYNYWHESDNLKEQEMIWAEMSYPRIIAFKHAISVPLQPFYSKKERKRYVDKI